MKYNDLINIINGEADFRTNNRGIEYLEKPFLIKRKCYSNICDKMMKYISIETGIQKNFVVYGNNGIGKTSFCAFLCKQFKQSNFQVIFRALRNTYFYKGVEENKYHPISYLPQRNVKNPSEKSIFICNNIPISEDEYSQDDVVILVTDMQLKKYKVMRSKRAPIQFCLLPFNSEEMELYGEYLHITVQNQENYGGIPGLVAMNVKEIIKKCQKIDIYSGIPAEYNEFVYIYDVENEFEVPKKLKFISDYIEKITLNKVVIDDSNFNIYYSLLIKKIEGDNDRIGGEGGYHYEHLILYCEKSKYENIIENKLELNKLNEKALPFLIDCSFQSNFESVDAIEINEKCINGIQVTVSDHHSIKESVAILFNVIFQETYEKRREMILGMFEEKRIDELAETLYYLGYTPSSFIAKELNIYMNKVNEYLLTESELRFGFKLPFLFELVTIPEKDIDGYVDTVIKEITIENMNKIFDKDELEDIINGFGFEDDELKIINTYYSKDVLEVLKELKKNNGKWENTVVDIKLAPSKKNAKTVKNKPNIPKEIEELKNNEIKWREYEKMINKKPFENYKNDNVKVIMKKKIEKLIVDAKDYAYDCSIQNVINNERTIVDMCKKRVEIMKKKKDEIIKEIDEEIKEMIKKGITDDEKKYFNQTYLDKCYNPRFVITMISHKYDVTMDIEESFDFSKYTDILGPKMMKYIKHIYPSYDTFDNDEKERIMKNKFNRVEKTNEIISYIELDRKRINDPYLNIDLLYYENDNKKNIVFEDEDLKITLSLIKILSSNEIMNRFLDSNFIYLNPSNLLCSSYKEGLYKLDMILSNYISPTTFYTKDGQRRNYCDCRKDNTKPILNPLLLIELVKEGGEEKVKFTNRYKLYPDNFEYDNLYSLILKAKGNNRNEVYYITEYLSCPYCNGNTRIPRKCEYVNYFNNRKTFYCDKCKMNVSCQPKLDNKNYKTELKYVKDGINIYYNKQPKESYKYNYAFTNPGMEIDDSSYFSSADTTMENEGGRKDEDNNNAVADANKRKRKGTDLENEKEIKKGKYDNNKHEAFADNSEIEIEEVDEDKSTSDNPNKKIKTNNASSDNVATLPQPQSLQLLQSPIYRNSFDYVKRIFDIEKTPPSFLYNELLIEIDESIKLFQYPNHKILVRDYYPQFWKRIEYNIIYNCFYQYREDVFVLKKLLEYLDVIVDNNCSIDKLNEKIEKVKEKIIKFIKCKPTIDGIISYYLLRGQPGCGKSTFLIYFILKFIQLKEKLGINLGLAYYKSSKKEDGSPDNPVIYNLIGKYLEENGIDQEIIICDSYDVPKDIFRLSSIIVNVSSPDNKNYSNIKDFNDNKVYFYLDICNEKEIDIWKENCLPEELGNAINKNLISLYNRVPRHLYFAAIYKAYYGDRSYWKDIYTKCIRTTVNTLGYFGFIKKYLFPCERGNESNLEEDVGLMTDRLDTDMSHYIVQYKVLDYESIDKVQLEYISKKVFKYLYFCTSHRCSENEVEIIKQFFFNKIISKNNHPLYKLLFNELVWYSLMYNEKWKNNVIKFNNDQMNIFNKYFRYTTTSIGCGEGFYIAPIDIGSDDLCYVINNVVVFPLYYPKTLAELDSKAIIEEKCDEYKQYFIEYSKDIQCGLKIKLFTVEDIVNLRKDDICCFIRKNANIK